MKVQNTYVGELYNIRNGAVYVNLNEAVKEVRRPLNPGIAMVFIALPDAEKYWIGGTVGENTDPRFNKIFTSDSALNQHMDSLKARGWPNAQLYAKELLVNTRGPDVPDIKTEDHFRTEKELGEIKKAIERGIPVSNALGEHAPLVLEWDDSGSEQGLPAGYRVQIDFNQYAVIDIENHPLKDLENPQALLTRLGLVRSLLLSISDVDPDIQPRKWDRLQQMAIQYASSIEPIKTDYSEAKVTWTMAGKTIAETIGFVGEPPKVGDEYYHNDKPFVIVGICEFEGRIEVWLRNK